MSLVACQRDPMLRTLETRVAACTPAGDRWDLVLDDTVLYPEGGGQPADRGSVGEVHVDDVQVRDGQVVHRADAPLEAGRLVRVEVDWARRFDHMQQHTGQHLLTAVAQDRFGWSTTSFHLMPRIDGRPVPRCDIELDGTPTEGELLELERLVNRAIREDHPVTARELARAEYDRIQVRSRGIPDSVTTVRIVEIEGIDANTCGGTHVVSTGQLQALKLLGTERIRGGTRLFYAAGGRVLDLLEEATRRTDQLNRLLSEGPEAHADAIERLLARTRAAEKGATALQGELAELLGDALAARSERVLGLHRDSAEIPFLNAVANRALTKASDKVLLLTAGEPEGAFLLAGPPERVAAHKDAVFAILEARGGGRPGRLQGRAARLDRRQDALDHLRGSQ